MKKLFNLAISLLKKHREVISYLFFGGVTTAVKFIVFYIFFNLFGLSGKGLEENISNAAAWFFAVLTAFITNKLFVFESKSFEARLFFKEIAAFYSARLLTGLAFEGGLFFIGATLLNLNVWLVQVVVTVFVIVSNYFLSKFLVFRKREAR